MTLEEIKMRKKELGYSNQQLSEISGVPLGTLSKILSGVTEAPRYDTLHAIEQALRARTRESVTYSGDSAQNDGPGRALSIIRDASAVYEAKTGYTLDDYLALPNEGPRMELIDGVFYDMGEPTIAHQTIAGYVYKKLLDFVFEKKGPCIPVVSPVAVQLDKDDKTVVEPDVLVVCDRDKIVKGRVFGAPDFILEVLSPSTRKKDMNLKAYKYQNAGVREYWIADPKTQKLLVYDYENGTFPAIYTFEDQVPVHIWRDECVIELSEMKEFMGFLL